jgi:N-acetylglutamate synthase-like GNAT family acetyltransferase
MSRHEDRELKCVDCGNSFVWTAGEQEFFQEKGFTEPPKRCKACRQVKKDLRGEGR